MATKIICDACGHTIDDISQHSLTPEPRFYGQKLIVKQSMTPSDREYTLDLHYDCANRILIAIGAERGKIKEEQFKPKQ